MFLPSFFCMSEMFYKRPSVSHYSYIKQLHKWLACPSLLPRHINLQSLTAKWVLKKKRKQPKQLRLGGEKRSVGQWLRGKNIHYPDCDRLVGTEICGVWQPARELPWRDGEMWEKCLLSYRFTQHTVKLCALERTNTFRVLAFHMLLQSHCTYTEISVHIFPQVKWPSI